MNGAQHFHDYMNELSITSEVSEVNNIAGKVEEFNLNLRICLGYLHPHLRY